LEDNCPDMHTSGPKLRRRARPVLANVVQLFASLKLSSLALHTVPRFDEKLSVVEKCGYSCNARLQ
jgi:hypothetical protein